MMEIDWSKPIGNETALLSEASFSKYWDRPEEDEAWKSLAEDWNSGADSRWVNVL